jgi:zinc protease
VVHRDNLDRFADIVLRQLLEPGLRDDDFARVKQRQANALAVDLRTNNEEELGKERLQANIYAGGPYGHPTPGTVAGIEPRSRTCDVHPRVRRQPNDWTAGDVRTVRRAPALRNWRALPPGELPAPTVPRRPPGIESDH